MTHNEGAGASAPALSIERKNVTESPIAGWMKEIQKVAKKASFDWPGIVGQEDLVQEVCVHILERPGTQQDLSEMDDNSRYQTLHKIAQRIASQERTDYEHFTGNFRYSVDEVRDALLSGALGALGRIILSDTGSRLQASWSAEDYISTGSDHSDTVIDMVSMEQDLAAGLAEVARGNTRYYDLLIRKFLRGEVFPTGSADSKALQRAVGLLTTKMNRVHKAGVPYVAPEKRLGYRERPGDPCPAAPHVPVDDWGRYYGWYADRVDYEDSLGEIHEPKPELVPTHPDGLGTFNIKRGRSA